MFSLGLFKKADPGALTGVYLKEKLTGSFAASPLRMT
jgi:hypothetical protein